MTLILFETFALYKTFTYLLTYLLTYIVRYELTAQANYTEWGKKVEHTMYVPLLHVMLLRRYLLNTGFVFVDHRRLSYRIAEKAIDFFYYIAIFLIQLNL